MPVAMPPDSQEETDQLANLGYDEVPEEERQQQIDDFDNQPQPAQEQLEQQNQGGGPSLRDTADMATGALLAKNAPKGSLLRRVQSGVRLARSKYFDARSRLFRGQNPFGDKLSEADQLRKAQGEGRRYENIDKDKLLDKDQQNSYKQLEKRVQKNKAKFGDDYMQKSIPGEKPPLTEGGAIEPTPIAGAEGSETAGTLGTGAATEGASTVGAGAAGTAAAETGAVGAGGSVLAGGEAAALSAGTAEAAGIGVASGAASAAAGTAVGEAAGVGAGVVAGGTAVATEAAVGAGVGAAGGPIGVAVGVVVASLVALWPKIKGGVKKYSKAILITLALILLIPLIIIGLVATQTLPLTPSSGSEKQQTLVVGALSGDSRALQKVTNDVITAQNKRYSIVQSLVDKNIPSRSAEVKQKIAQIDILMNQALASPEATKVAADKRVIQAMSDLDSTLPFGDWIASEAKSHVGNPNQSFCLITGATSTRSCASFVSSVLYLAGVPGTIVPNTTELWNDPALRLIIDRSPTIDSSRIDLSKLKPGDIVWFGNGDFGGKSRYAGALFEHVGIYIGGGNIVDTSSTKGTVQLRPITTHKISGSGIPTFNGAKRYGSN